jgi:hypothetical protein
MNGSKSQQQGIRDEVFFLVWHGTHAEFSLLRDGADMIHALVVKRQTVKGSWPAMGSRQVQPAWFSKRGKSG